MDIILIQADLVWRSPDANFGHMEDMLAKSRKADLIVLPEMFPTGFVTDPAMVERQTGDDALRWMQKMARIKNAAIVGSVAVADEEHFYNRCFFVRPNGSFEAYDKRHLFAIGGENRSYVAGNKRVIVEWAGFRILMQICYDLRFPVFSRNRGDYDMAIYVANWPDVRRQVWDNLLKARAIENVSYVAGVNRIGRDHACRYDGGTAFVGFRGEVMCVAEDRKENMLSVHADIEALREFRRKFPMLEDADDFELK